MNITKVLAGVCVVLAFWLWWVIDDYGGLKDKYQRLAIDSVNQSSLIASQSLQFNRFNQIATTAYRNGIQAEAKSQEKVIEYRTILKKEPACDQLVPQPIADGLLEYTHSLRAGAMHSDTNNVN